MQKTPTFQISERLNNFSFLSISAAKYRGKSMKEIPIANNNNSNHDAGEETDPYEEIDEKTINKQTLDNLF